MPQKTDLILVNPPISYERKGEYLPNFIPHISIGCLGTYLDKVGIRTRIVESNLLKGTVKDLAQTLVRFSPQIVGFTLTTIGVSSAGALATEIKRLNANIHIIVGGPHVTALPVMTLDRYPQFDMGVIGEGEQTMHELCDALLNNGNYEHVKGICYRKGHELIETEPRERKKNIDTYALPNYELYYPAYPENYHVIPPYSVDKPVASFLTSRGCPFTCTFCDTSVHGNVIRYHSVDFVMDYMKHLQQRYNVKNLIFFDDSFLMNKKRVREICERIKSELGNVKWTCMGRITDVDLETLKLMKSAGCYLISYGIESGSQRILDSINKKTTLEKIETGLNLTKEAGIQTRGFFVLGFPGETEETVTKTIDCAVKMPFDFAQFTYFTPMPGSRISQDVHKYGRVVADWDRMNFVNLAFVPEKIPAAKLTELRRQAYRKFYFRPKIFLNIMKNSLRGKGYIRYTYANVSRVIRSSLK